MDLFAGPGRGRVGRTGAIVDGSPLIAAQHTGAPFTKLICADLKDDNVRALEGRLTTLSRPAAFFEGDCNVRIDEIVAEIPPHGLNVALLDPYGLSPLRFETIGKLASIKRMDIVLHFPTMDIKRNFERNFNDETPYITQFLGTEEWKKKVQRPQDAVHLIDLLRERLGAFGYTQDNIRSLEIKENGRIFYHLMFLTKQPLGNKIWESIARTDAKGQKGFPW